MPGTSNVDLVGSIRNAIARRLAHGHPSIRDVATTIGINVRTLQRRLARVGVTYGRLVDEVRLETAARLIEDRDLTLAKISSALGYADPAHFTRAFARWTGMTPRTYRQRGKVKPLRPTEPPQRTVGNMTEASVDQWAEGSDRASGQNHEKT